MKKISIHIIFLLPLFFGLTSCDLFPETIPRPIPAIDAGPISLDYDYANSITKSGWVRFIDLSSGIVEYDWDFGFKENGEPVKSYTGAPKVRFPSNGHYNVQVQGISYIGDTLTITKSVIVTNY